MDHENSSCKFEIQCPLDKTKHLLNKSGNLEENLPINYAILQGLDAYNKEKKYGNFYKRYCSVQGHSSESLNFYCKSHQQLLC